MYHINTLDSIASKYYLDKSISTGCHNYIPGYTTLFENIRDKVKVFLEIGIGSIENGQMSGVIPLGYRTGNSLRCWSEYFNNSVIYGIDIFDCSQVDTDRIKTFIADQSNENDLLKVINTINSPIDIIIDDGSHGGEHQVFSFIVLNKFLSSNGIYVIEDIQPQNIEGFKDLSIFPSEYKDYILKNYNINIFDTRYQRGREDDFMIAFIKK